MKTIVFVLPNLAGGGAERATLNYLQMLDRNEWRPVLVVLRNTGELKDRVDKGIELRIGLKGMVSAAMQADLLVGALELTATYLSVLVGKWCFRRTVIGWVHTNLALYPPARRLVHRFCLNLFYPHLDGVWAVSPSAAASITRLFPALKDKTAVLGNPIQLETIRQLAKGSIPVQNGAPLLLGVGKLDPNKRFDQLIHVHADLVQAGIPNRLVILGTGPEEAHLRQLTQERQVENSVLLFGFTANPYPWLKAAAVVVVPSEVEGLSTVILEALALGRTVVSTDCPGGLLEFQIDEPNAVVPVGDVAAMVAAVRLALTDNDLRRRFEEKGPQIAARFDAARVIQKFRVLAEGGRWNGHR